MRPISFRIWHVRLKRLLFVAGIEFDAGEISTVKFLDPQTKKFSQVDLFDFHHKNTNPKVHFMQFTGFYDINACEIFEGDIVKWKGDTFQILFFEGRFCVGNSLGVSNNFFVGMQSEVIGNIWQDAELATKVALPTPKIDIDSLVEAYDKAHPKSAEY